MGGMADGRFARDPVSVAFDAGARRLLDRAYARPGVWQGTVLAGPRPGARLRLAAAGINPDAPDPAPGGAARTRWARGFVRAVYYQHRWWSEGGGPGWRTARRRVARSSGALRFEVGRATGAGRAVRIIILPGGAAAAKAVKRMPASRRIYTDSGAPGARWSDPADRDY